MESQSSEPQPIVLYDDDCGSASGAWTRSWPGTGAVACGRSPSKATKARACWRAFPNQSGSTPGTWCCRPARCARPAPLRRRSPSCCREAGRWRSCSGPFPALTDRAYRRVAANRNRFARWLGIDASCELRR